MDTCSKNADPTIYRELIPVILCGTAAAAKITGIATASTGVGVLVSGIFAARVTSKKDSASTSSDTPTHNK